MERPPSTAWPQIDDLIESLAGLYSWVDPLLGKLTPVGGGKMAGEDTLIADHTAWAYAGEIAFQSIGRIDAPLFLLLDVEVFSGAFQIAILAGDGGSFVGGHHTQRAGRALVQLPIFDQPVRGVVFQNAGPGEAGGTLRVHRARLARYERNGNAAAKLRQLLETESGSLPAEVDSPTAVPATLPLAFHRLLALGRIHETTRLLAAINDFTGDRPAWLEFRLAELLVGCLAEPVQAMAQFAVAEEGETNEIAGLRLPQAALSELVRLKQLNRGAAIVSLHQEILQGLATLDLVSISHPCRVRFNWTRQAFASTPVRSGTLSALLTLLVERIREPNPLIEIEVRSTVAGTSIEIRSPLDPGALQYRAHSLLADELHRALCDSQCPLPSIEHHLGAEGIVHVQWGVPHAPATHSTITFERLENSGVEALYNRTDGHAVRVESGICYKSAPADTSKRNDLVVEAGILQRLSGTQLAPESLAAVRTHRGTALSYRYVPGIMLSAWAIRQPAPLAITHVLLGLTNALAELNRLGVQHRDVRAENVLIDSSGGVCLVDFDQARIAADADDFGNDWAGGGVCCGFGGLIGQLGWRAEFLRTAGALGFAWELGRFSSANSPGKHSCYYDWRWGGYELRGERPWYQRWDLLRQIFEQRGLSGRFLELGCNLGLLSTHASLAGWEVTGIDHNALAVAAADEIASALGASAQFRRGDLCTPQLFETLVGGYELVSALSVVHWLPDPQPVETFLRSQKRLLFEGHRSITDETKYLRALGFSQIELLGYSERLRPLFYASRL